MENKQSRKISMRIIHRYLGFFLAGIMLVYALSGIVLIFRRTELFKVEKKIEKQIDADISAKELGKNLEIRNLKISKTMGDTIYFENGTYNSKTGIANYTLVELPFILNKLTHLHKASTNDPLYWLNIFFGSSLLFFAISSVWMFKPKTQNFHKGLVVTLIGIVLTLLLLFL